MPPTARLQPGFFEQGLDDVAGRSRIGGAFQDDELTLAKGFGDCLGRLNDELEIRLPGFGQGSRHADQDAVHLGETGEVTGGLESGGFHLPNHRFGNVGDVAFPLSEQLDFRGIHVKAKDGQTLGGEGPGQGKTDISQADDSHAKLFGPDLVG